MSSDSGHWYDKHGNPCHTQKTLKGGTRPTNVKDARSLGLYPSVTSVLGILEKPQLVTWKQEQVAIYSYSNPPQDGENTTVYAERMVRLASQQVKDAADLGTNIHAELEEMIHGRAWSDDYAVYVAPVKAWMEQNKIVAKGSETTFADIQHGYAGTIDLPATVNGKPAIIDFKTRKTKPGEKVTPWDTQPMQVAAYGFHLFGFDFEVGCNLYISTTQPGRIEAVWYTRDELNAAFHGFLGLLEAWKYLKGYDPTTNEANTFKPHQ